MRTVFVFLLCLSTLYQCKHSSPGENRQRVVDNGPHFDRAAIADSMEFWMKKLCLDPWYPEAIDSAHGGYYSDFDFAWNLDGPQNKMIVSQARHIWSASLAAEYYEVDDFSKYARHGYEFLRDKMWDSKHGGFYQLVEQDGTPVAADEKYGIVKTAYGNAFGIYGLAAYYRISKDEDVLQLAKNAFYWLESNSYDPIHGGYFQFLLQDGTALEGGHARPPKDQNSSIHLLEAFTELYKVWPDSLVRTRVAEMLVLIRDGITTEVGSLTLFSQSDWRPVTNRDSSEAFILENISEDHLSFGHDIETAYLLMEASHVIKHPEDLITKRKAKVMVDHTLRHGWDDEYGGIFDGGYHFGDDTDVTIVLHHKAWWAQMEAMNTLLIMSDMYPDNEIGYANYFLQMWDYNQNYLFDKEYHGIYVGGLDQEPEARTADKGGIWKVNYHNLRSLMNCVVRLRMDI